MNIELTAHEARVVGCLMEKEVTTPEQYPLWINALTNACNQKSNREPVLSLDENTVQQVVDGLLKKHLVSDRPVDAGTKAARLGEQHIGKARLHHSTPIT